MKTVGKVLGVLLVAWFGTIAAAAALAMQRKRDAPAVPEPDADEIELSAIFGPLDFRSTAAAFRGGTIECWFGGGTVDLREATLHPDGATLRATAVFGGGQILVPDAWIVETRVVGIGGVGDARHSAAAGSGASLASPKLLIEGTVAFGGFGVLSSDPRVEARAGV
jgi:hypothetical protein